MQSRDWHSLQRFLHLLVSADALEKGFSRDVSDETEKSASLTSFRSAIVTPSLKERSQAPELSDPFVEMSVVECFSLRVVYVDERLSLGKSFSKIVT